MKKVIFALFAFVLLAACTQQQIPAEAPETAAQPTEVETTPVEQPSKENAKPQPLTSDEDVFTAIDNALDALE